MITLLVICFILVGFIGYLALKITEFRKAQHYALLNNIGTEMTEHR
jgi:hypothetical protein